METNRVRLGDSLWGGVYVMVTIGWSISYIIVGDQQRPRRVVTHLYLPSDKLAFLSRHLDGSYSIILGLKEISQRS